MSDKKFKDVLPCGVLKTRTGEKYWLIKPEPVVRDSWQHDRQQRFLVVQYEEIGVHDFNESLGNQFVYSYVTHLITTDPDIRYLYTNTTIKVWDLQEWDAVEAELNPKLEDYLTISEPGFSKLTLEEMDEYIESVENEV